MKEVLITSSVLILALLALRGIFRRSLSRRVQYALWGLVALRLLVPVNLPAAQHSVLTAAEPVRAAITERMETPHTIRPRQTAPSAPEIVTPAPGGDGDGGGAIIALAAGAAAVAVAVGVVTTVAPVAVRGRIELADHTVQANARISLLQWRSSRPASFLSPRPATS